MRAGWPAVLLCQRWCPARTAAKCADLHAELELGVHAVLHRALRKANGSDKLTAASYSILV